MEPQITKQELAPHVWQFELALPRAAVEARAEAKLRALAPSLELKGFRPGKVPLLVLKQRYGKQAASEAQATWVQELVRHAFLEHGLHPATAPEVEPTGPDDPEVYRWRALFEVFPELPTIDPAALEVHLPEVTITHNDVGAVMLRTHPKLVELLREQTDENPVTDIDGWDPHELARFTRDEMQEDLDYRLREELRDAAEEALLEAFPDLPISQAILDAEWQRHLDELEIDHYPEGEVEPERQRLLEDLQITCLLYEIARQNGLRPSAEALFDYARDFAKSTDDPETTLDEIFADAAMLHDFEDEMVRERAIQWVLDHAPTVHTPVPYPEFVGMGEADWTKEIEPASAR
jgi:FKBP-type peptidyl-prolyl cis-trans isomerase (trigger factor)